MKAAMDIGSNSLRLLVIDEAGGTSQVIRQEVEETRLGAGFKEGMLLAASVDRTLEVLERWKKELAAEGISQPLIFATSAVRDAGNREAFAEAVLSRTGCPLRILSGEEEAWYSFSGAVSGFDFPREQCLLIDIGGGSTELAGFAQGHLSGMSMPVGAVRWQVMNFRRSEVKRKMAARIAMKKYDDIRYFIGVGGTITTVAAVLGSVTAYTREAIHGKSLDYATLTALHRRLETMTLEERKAVPGMPPARAEVILYGMDILEILFELLSIPKLYISDWGILDGILAE